MGIILTFLFLILGIGLPIAVQVFMNIDIFHFSVFFIIPIGAIIIGFISAKGYFSGKIKTNTLVTKKHILIGILIAIFCAISSKYIIYTLTCLDETTYEYYYSLDGDHISNYSSDEYESFDFVNFTKYSIENTPISFSRRSRTIGTFTNSTFGWIYEVICFLGIIFGAYWTGSIALEKPYCNNCNLYKKSLKGFEIPFDKGPEFFEAFKSSINTVDLGTTSKSIINQYKSNCKKSKSPHYLGTFIYCESCKSTILKFTLQELNSKGRFEENDDFEFNCNIDYNIINEYTA